MKIINNSIEHSFETEKGNYSLNSALEFQSTVKAVTATWTMVVKEFCLNGTLELSCCEFKSEYYADLWWGGTERTKLHVGLILEWL